MDILRPDPGVLQHRNPVFGILKMVPAGIGKETGDIPVSFHLIVVGNQVIMEGLEGAVP